MNPMPHRTKSSVTPPAHSPIVLACLSSSSQDASVLRAAQRLARGRNSGWMVVYLELWDDHKENRHAARNWVLEQLALAERMGAVCFTTKSAEYARGLQDALAECTRREVMPVLLVAAGVNEQSPLQARRASAALQEFAQRHAVECMLVAPAPLPTRHVGWFERLHMRRLRVVAVAAALSAVALSFGTSALLHNLLPSLATEGVPTHSYMIYLIACAVVAARFGFMPGLITGVASLVVLRVQMPVPEEGASLADLLNLGLFVVTCAIVSVINSQVHAEAELSESNEWRMQALLRVYKIALHARSRDEALAELHQNLKQFLQAEIAVYLPALLNGQLQKVWPEDAPLAERDLVLLHQAWDDAKQGREAEVNNPATGWRFMPLISANGELGMLALRLHGRTSLLHTEHDQRYLRMIAELVASILEKIESTTMREASRVQDEREKLRTSLLSSVSHDLKTPLAAILGSLSVHRSMYDKLPEDQRRELTDAALSEAQRLDSFITNILDLAKFESGAVRFKQEWQAPEDLLLRVKKRMRLRLTQHRLQVRLDDGQAEIEIDPVTAEQALVNVLDNAIKYTAPDTVIEVSSSSNEQYFCLHIRDHGTGIPEEEQQRIFDKYTRLQRKDHQVAGTGLGLAVASAAMRGQGGEIEVKNHPEGGAIFTLCWSRWRRAGTSSKRAS